MTDPTTPDPDGGEPVDPLQRGRDAVAADPRLADLHRSAEQLQAAKADADGWRERRNQQILEMRRLPEPPSIEKVAAAANVRHGYVSRVVKGGGTPASGSTEHRTRQRRASRAAS